MEDKKIDIDEKQAYVQKNFVYYNTEWKKIDEGKVSFNVAAFLFPILWLGYRKMYKPIIVIALMYLVVTTLNIIAGPNICLRVISSIYTLMISFFFGFLGNKMYEKQTALQIEAALKETENKHHREKRLKKKGGISSVGVLLAVLLVFCTYTIPIIIINFILL